MPTRDATSTHCFITIAGSIFIYAEDTGHHGGGYKCTQWTKITRLESQMAVNESSCLEQTSQFMWAFCFSFQIVWSNLAWYFWYRDNRYKLPKNDCFTSIIYRIILQRGIWQSIIEQVKFVFVSDVAQTQQKEPRNGETIIKKNAYSHQNNAQSQVFEMRSTKYYKNNWNKKALLAFAPKLERNVFALMGRTGIPNKIMNYKIHTKLWNE